MAKLPPPDDDDAIADANMLFGDSPARPKSSRSEPTKPPVSEEYDVEGWDDQDDAPAPVARAPIASPKPEKKKPKRDPLPDDDEPRVIEVWSRWGEWSNTILKMAGAGAIILVIVYSLLNSGAYSPAFLIFLIGVAILAALSYPIAITLERPVRMTPEQAIRDYFAALSHHFPQYRRMWLLLSERGRNAREFSAFPEYQIIMKKRLAELQRREAWKI